MPMAKAVARDATSHTPTQIAAKIPHPEPTAAHAIAPAISAAAAAAHAALIQATHPPSPTDAPGSWNGVGAVGQLAGSPGVSGRHEVMDLISSSTMEDRRSCASAGYAGGWRASMGVPSS